MTRPRTRHLLAAGLAAVALVAAGCGGESATADEPTTQADGAGSTEPLGGVVDVETALATPGRPLTAHGWIIDESGLLKLCTTRIETEPPGCGDPSIVLDGYAGTISAVAEVEVDGTVEGDRLVVDLQALLDKGNAG